MTKVSKWRLEKAINSCYIVHCTGNNDLASLKRGLKLIGQQKLRSKKMVILSDLNTASQKSDILEINKFLEHHNINRIIGIGPELAKNATVFKIPSTFFNSTADFLLDFNTEDIKEKIILIKGTPEFKFQKIVELLQEKVHSTQLEINFSAITHNLNFYRSLVKGSTKLMVMVKAFAYGSGMLEVANLLQFNKVDYLGVAYTDEGVSLRKNGIDLPIMVMNPSPGGYEQLLKYNLEPEVYGMQEFNSLVEFLNGRKLKIHLKVDTGMNRLGFQEGQLQQLISLLKKNENLEIASVFSHLAAADEAAHELFTRKQAEIFVNFSDYLCSFLNMNPSRHLLNSAGIIRYPEYQFNMVRLGIGLYGAEPAKLAQKNLKTISTLKTVVSQIKEVKAGNTIGYGRKGKAKEKKTIAIIAIGYGDGYSRLFSNGKGEVLINGKRAPVIGNVCMDMTMVDITGIEANEGDDVVVFGENPTINELAESIGTIPYEILTSISERVKKVYLYD